VNVIGKVLSVIGLAISLLWVVAIPQGTVSGLNGDIVVDGVAYEQKPDIGIGINKAYAALPGGGGRIIVPPGSFNFATPIVFGTANKPAILVGSGSGTSLTYTPTSGTAVVMNYGPGIATNHPRGGGLRDLVLNGPTTGTATGLFLGGTNGAEGFKADSLKISGFNVDLSWGDNTWGTEFNNSIIRNGSTNLIHIGPAKNSGEQTDFIHTTFIQDTGTPGSGRFASAVSINNFDFDVNLVNCSFDNAQLALLAGYVGFNNLHMEWLNAQNAPYISVSTGAIYGSGLDLLNDVPSTTASAAIAVGGGSSRFAVNGVRIGSNGYTFPSLLALTGGAEISVMGNLGGSFRNPVSVSNFTGNYVIHQSAPPADSFIFGAGARDSDIQIKNESANGQSWAIDSLSDGTLSVFPKSGHGTIALNGSGVTVGAGGMIHNIYSGSAILTFTPISAQSCQEQTLAVRGAVAGQGAFFSPGASLGNPNLSWSSWISASNMVSVRLCNPSNNVVRPSAVTWNGWVQQ
jgi:hypothetical protein